MWKWLWVSALIIALDLWTKALVSGSLTLHQVIPVFPGFNLVLYHNFGAAFSFLSDAGGWQRWFFTAISSVISLFLLGWLFRLKREQGLLAVAICFVLGGALGNLYDRVTLGYVVDFLEFYISQYRWPAFNVADSAVFIGAALFAWDIFKEHQRQSQENQGNVSEKNSSSADA